MISVSVQKGNSVYVYNEKNNLLFTKTGLLNGYTSNTVSVRRGNVVYTYSDTGSLISTHITR